MKTRVLCPHCSSPRLIPYESGKHQIIVCSASGGCRRLFAIVQNCKTIAVYSLQHNESYAVDSSVQGGN